MSQEMDDPVNDLRSRSRRGLNRTGGGLGSDIREIGTTAILRRIVLPLLLLSASLLNWSLISLGNMLIYLSIQFIAPKTGIHLWRLYLTLWCTVTFSVLAILAQVTFHIIWCFEGNDWIVPDSLWIKLIGFVRVQPWGSSSVVYFMITQLATALVAFVDIHNNSLYRDSCWSNFSSAVDHIGSHLRVGCCLLLPAIQLVVGISHPSWISLPFFVCSCVGLVDWSLTSNFLGLFRWRRPLLIYACCSVLLLYIYQLPAEFPSVILILADFIGLYKITTRSEWPELCSGISLLMFHFMLSSVKRDLDEMDSIISMEDGSLSERLLPSKHSFFIRQSRSGERHTNVLLRGPVFRNFSINFFTYGFPVGLFVLFEYFIKKSAIQI